MAFSLSLSGTEILIGFMVIVILFVLLIGVKQQPIIGGCAGTRYGCCPGCNIAKVDQMGSNCPKNPNPKPLIGGCGGTQYGCCPNTKTPKIDYIGSNCKPTPHHAIGGCSGTRYGCCPYSELPKLNEIGSNC
jgi:hypothetical protein